MEVALSEQYKQKIIDLTNRFIAVDADDNTDNDKQIEQAKEYLASLVSVVLDIVEDSSPERQIKYKSALAEIPMDRAADSFVATGQAYWDEVRSFVKEKSGIDLYKWAFIAFLQTSLSEDDSCKFIIDAMGRYLDDYEAAYKKTEDDTEKIAKKASEMGPEILKEYFDLMRRLGVFYNNRDDYKTDEERKMYDRIMEIYAMIKLG